MIIMIQYSTERDRLNIADFSHIKVNYEGIKYIMRQINKIVGKFSVQMLKHRDLSIFYISS